MAYAHPPFNYTGSKFKYLPQLLPLFPKEVLHYCEPFFGSGAVGYNVTYPNVYANDVLKPLIRAHEQLLELSPASFFTQVKQYAPGKKDKYGYNRLRAEFNDKHPDDPFRFYALLQSCTNNMIRYNKKGKFNQTHGKRTITQATEQKVYAFKQAIKSKAHTKYEFRARQFDWFLEWVVKNLPAKSTFLFFDPPYLISEAGYNAFWTQEIENSLYEWLSILDEKSYKWGITNFSKHKGKENKRFQKLASFSLVQLNTDYKKVGRKQAGETVEYYVANYPLPTLKEQAPLTLFDDNETQH